MIVRASFHINLQKCNGFLLMRLVATVGMFVSLKIMELHVLKVVADLGVVMISVIQDKSSSESCCFIL